MHVVGNLVEVASALRVGEGEPNQESVKDIASDLFNPVLMNEQLLISRHFEDIGTR